MKKILIITMFAVTACNTYTPPPTYEEVVMEIMEDCNKRLDAGDYGRFSDMLAECQKQRTIDAFIYHRDGRDVDLLTEMLDYQIKVARDLESNKITEEQAKERLEKFTNKQTEKFTARQEKRLADAERAAKKAQKEREAEEKRLADYYKKHPHEYQKMLLQQRQLELLEQQNRLLAEQQAEQKRAEERRRLKESLDDLADSFRRPSPVICNTMHGSYSSSTTCY